GRTVAIWRAYREGRPRLVVELPGGYRRIVPVDWTSRRPTQICPRVKDRLVLFGLERLIAAAQFVAEKLTTAIAGSSSAQVEARARTAASGAGSRRNRPVRGAGSVRDGSSSQRTARRLDGAGGAASGSRRRGR